MSDARTAILGNIARALDGVPSGVGLGEFGEVPRDYRHTGTLSAGSEQVLDLLVDRLEDYRAVVHRVAEGEIATAISQIIDDATCIVRPPSLPDGWLAQVPESTRVVTDGAPSVLTPYELDEIDAVVTAARVACADTGTIVLDGQPDQGRRAITLVPDTHVCVVFAHQVVHIVPEAVQILAANPERPLTWISGPSATSDIELNRVEGVHGPRNLHVVLVG